MISFGTIKEEKRRDGKECSATHQLPLLLIRIHHRNLPILVAQLPTIDHLRLHALVPDLLPTSTTHHILAALQLHLVILQPTPISGEVSTVRSGTRRSVRDEGGDVGFDFEGFFSLPETELFQTVLKNDFVHGREFGLIIIGTHTERESKRTSVLVAFSRREPD
jgi:hypothetical protein